MNSENDFNKGVLHLWSKFGDPNLNGWLVMVRTFKLDLEGQDQLHPPSPTRKPSTPTPPPPTPTPSQKQKRILRKVFSANAPISVIPAWMGYGLWCGQARDWRVHTRTHTDRRRQRQCPKARTRLWYKQMACYQERNVMGMQYKHNHTTCKL